MQMSGILEPSLGAYLSYYLGFCLRYFAVMGGIYWYFHLARRQKYLDRRIQDDFPSATEVGHEIRWSMLSGATTGLSTILLYRLILDGHTSMYFDVGERGWLYLAASVLAGLVSYDTCNYWQHRLLHTAWMFRHIHAVHHRIENPTVFASFARHPIEAMMEHAYFISFVVLVPVHPLAMAAIVAYFFAFGVIGHLGYEFYPRGFTRHPILGWINTATHHNMHHSHTDCNYGWFNLWDWLMGTNHPTYHDTFDAIKARRSAPGAAAVTATSQAA